MNQQGPLTPQRIMNTSSLPNPQLQHHKMLIQQSAQQQQQQQQNKQMFAS